MFCETWCNIKVLMSLLLLSPCVDGLFAAASVCIGPKWAGCGNGEVDGSDVSPSSSSSSSAGIGIDVLCWTC